MLCATALFWFALNANIGGLQCINDNWDISYGVYLYGSLAAIFTAGMTRIWLLGVSPY